MRVGAVRLLRGSQALEAAEGTGVDQADGEAVGTVLVSMGSWPWNPHHRIMVSLKVQPFSREGSARAGHAVEGQG